MGRFKTIKGLSEQRRLPRLGYIRLGVKVKRSGSHNCNCGPDAMCNKCSRPTETKHFIVPPEVAKVFGDTPTELDVALPLDALEDVFPQAYKMYGASGLKCEGNGEEALRRNEEGQWDERTCPCDHLDAKNGCKKVGNLKIIIPRVAWGGIYEVVTSSYNSMVDVQSGIDYIRGLVGRVVLVKYLKLFREPTPTTHTDPKTKKQHKQTHHTLKIRFTGTEAQIEEERLSSGKVLGKPRYLIAEEDRSGRDMPTLIETSAPEVGADGSEIIDMETGEVLNAERTTPGEGDDAKPAAPVKPGKKASKRASKKAAKPAKPKPTKPKDDAPAAAPATPPSDAAPAGEQPMTQKQITDLWEWVQRAWGADRLSDAKSFFGFFVKDYCGVTKSAEMPSKFFGMHLPELKKIAEIPDADKRGVAMTEMVQRLQGVIADRKAAQATA